MVREETAPLPQLPVPWPVTVAACVVLTHQALRFVFDWGHQAQLRGVHAVVLVVVGAGCALGHGLYARDPKRWLLWTQTIATLLPFGVALGVPKTSGPFSPFAHTVTLIVLVPASLAYGVLWRKVFGWWLGLAWKARDADSWRPRLGYVASVVASPWQSAAVQAVLGSLPALLMVALFPEVELTALWEHPSFPRRGLQVTLWYAECWGLALSAGLLAVLGVVNLSQAASGPARESSAKRERKQS